MRISVTNVVWCVFQQRYLMQVIFFEFYSVRCEYGLLVARSCFDCPYHLVGSAEVLTNCNGLVLDMQKVTDASGSQELTKYVILLS